MMRPVRRQAFSRGQPGMSGCMRNFTLMRAHRFMNARTSTSPWPSVSTAANITSSTSSFRLLRRCRMTRNQVSLATAFASEWRRLRSASSLKAALSATLRFLTRDMVLRRVYCLYDRNEEAMKSFMRIRFPMTRNETTNSEDQALVDQYPVMISRFTGVLVVVRHRVLTLLGNVANSVDEVRPPKITVPMKEKKAMWNAISRNMGKMRYKVMRHPRNTCRTFRVRPMIISGRSGRANLIVE
mmetsp:Transcript_6850/g.14139  ORF Transcript_6850/g.14139 Transcript_6850/m.14139 type:complete len:241 (-) Transcript_6850:703-1425(-)